MVVPPPRKTRESWGHAWFGMDPFERASKGFSELPLLRKICFRVGFAPEAVASFPAFDLFQCSVLRSAAAVSPTHDTSPQNHP